jgi:hypothetical protein
LKKIATYTHAQRLTTCLMAVIILVTSTGFGVLEHQCILRGKTISHFKIQEKTSGCSSCKVNSTKHTKKTTLGRSSCCSHKVSFQNLETSTTYTNKDSSVQSIDIDGISFVSWNFNFKSISPLNAYHLPRYAFDFPLLYGRSLLIFVQIFRI